MLHKALAPGLRCALLHAQPCARYYCAHLKPRHRLGLVRACEVCPTDVCVSARDVAGLGRVLALTVWKNYGGVYGSQWLAWLQQHRDFVGGVFADGRIKKVMGPKGKGADVAAAFEGFPGQARAHWYEPSVGPEVVELLSREPDVSSKSSTLVASSTSWMSPRDDR